MKLLGKSEAQRTGASVIDRCRMREGGIEAVGRPEGESE